MNRAIDSNVLESLRKGKTLSVRESLEAAFTILSSRVPEDLNSQARLTTFFQGLESHLTRTERVPGASKAGRRATQKLLEAVMEHQLKKKETVAKYVDIWFGQTLSKPVLTGGPLKKKLTRDRERWNKLQELMS